MKRTGCFAFVLECSVWLASLFRICVGQGEVFDYFIVLTSSVILAYDIYKMTKPNETKKEPKKEASDTEDGSSTKTGGTGAVLLSPDGNPVQRPLE